MAISCAALWLLWTGETSWKQQGFLEVVFECQWNQISKQTQKLYFCKPGWEFKEQNSNEELQFKFDKFRNIINNSFPATTPVSNTLYLHFWSTGCRLKMEMQLCCMRYKDICVEIIFPLVDSCSAFFFISLTLNFACRASSVNILMISLWRQLIYTLLCRAPGLRKLLVAHKLIWLIQFSEATGWKMQHLFSWKQNVLGAEMTFGDKAEIRQKCILFLFHSQADSYQSTRMHLEKEFKDGPSNVPGWLETLPGQLFFPCLSLRWNLSVLKAVKCLGCSLVFTHGDFSGGKYESFFQNRML